MTERVMMTCGHASNGCQKFKDGTSIPACVICGCTTIDTAFSGIPEGRQARCTTCHKSIADSSLRLPFFERRPDSEYDAFYCGCRGWD